MSSELRTIVIDDSVVVRRSLEELLSADPRINIVGSASNGSEGMKRILVTKPDLVFLDLEMPQMDGLTVLRIVRPRTDAKIVILSSHIGRGRPAEQQAKQLGADAVMPKPSGSADCQLIVIDRLILKLVQRMFPVEIRERAA